MLSGYECCSEQWTSNIKKKHQKIPDQNLYFLNSYLRALKDASNKSNLLVFVIAYTFTHNSSIPAIDQPSIQLVCYK